MNICLAISCLLALAASVHGDGLGYGGGLVYAPGHASVDYYAYPRYAFEYAVRDPHTGDNKAQWEKRDGDVVKGAYSLVEPDGSIRVVEYYADDKTGFNAVVKRLGPNLHPAVPASIYKAPIPVLGGLGHAPISVGPVAKLGGLAAAPLISGPILGGALSTANLVKPVAVAPIAPIIKSPILPYEPLIKAPIYEPVIKAPIYEPVIKTPIYEPIIKTPILPYEPVIKSPIVPFEPIVKSPILPIAKPFAPLLPYGGYEHLPGPIYKSGPILSDLAHISPILKSGPIYPGKLDLGLPILKEPYGLGYGGYNKDREILGHGLLANSWGLGNPYLGKH